MHIEFSPHGCDVTPSAAIGVQKELAGKVRTDVPVPLENVRLVAGVDVSCARGDPMLTAGIVVWDRLEGRIVDSGGVQTAMTFPYIPGLLSFREIPGLLQAIAGLTTEPDVWLVDGQGIAHPRRMGIATHLGLVLDRPTIGVAKSRLTGRYTEPGLEAGNMSPLTDGTEQIGAVYRSKVRSNPLFISAGHLIDMQSSLAIVQACLRGYRLPEPTRRAHLHVNAVRTGASPRAGIVQQHLL